MTKVLKPFTIIPSELYVQRDADRQIKNIITDMGRPGYVLVSRQMGKTNLLLNAKRTLETSEDIFLYIDLSNPFDDAKSCFENIIDTAIEVNEAKFKNAKKIINERRQEMLGVPPHKQHTSELRLLLNCIAGKLVIILDEIDALAKTQYSDLIFAQIRSVYFSRVNFREFEKLTYILSGVIEPIDIIKDPKISPFNIGQKIYLNDFNLNEFNQFLIKSKLKLDKLVSERIYFWTNGNPRITWDLCSEIENLQREDELSEELIDKTVQELYLTSFDKPPIDNIRELVTQDRAIRNSIIEIAYNKSREISDSIKNKLYLAGIVNYSEREVQIKNEIIKKSLSIEWIKTLEDHGKFVLQSAIDHYKKNEYLDAIGLFESFLVDNEFDPEVKSVYGFYLGHSYYKVGRHDKAVQHLEMNFFDIEDDPSWYYRNLNILGSALYGLERIPESLSKLKLVVESGRRDSDYALALINYGITLMKSSEIAQQNEAINIFHKIIEETTFNKDKINAEYVQELRAISLNYMARLQTKQDRIEEAKSNYRKAIDISKITQKPPILLALFDITVDFEEKKSLLNEIISLIDLGGCNPSDSVGIQSNEFNLVDFKYLVYRVLLYDSDAAVKLFPFFKLLGEGTIAEHLVDIATAYLSSTKDWVSGMDFLQVLILNFDNKDFNFDLNSRYQTIKVRAIGSDRKKNRANINEYFALFPKVYNIAIDQVTFDLFSREIYYLIEDNNIGTALRYIRLISDFKDTVGEDLFSNFIVILNLELNAYVKLNESRKVIETAKNIISMADNDKMRLASGSLLGEKGLKTIVSNARFFLNQESISTKPFKAMTYSRNQIVLVRYKNGQTFRIKFKKVEKDIQAGNCFVVE